ncbi:unnamed protein product [Eretmochelys imbricata]
MATEIPPVTSPRLAVSKIIDSLFSRCRGPLDRSNCKISTFQFPGPLFFLEEPGEDVNSSVSFSAISHCLSGREEKPMGMNIQRLPRNHWPTQDHCLKLSNLNEDNQIQLLANHVSMYVI